MRQDVRKEKRNEITSQPGGKVPRPKKGPTEAVLWREPFLRNHSPRSKPTSVKGKRKALEEQPCCIKPGST